MAPRSSLRPWALSLLSLGALVCGPVAAQGADLCAAASVLSPGTTAAAFDTNVCADTGAPATSTPLAIQPCSSIGADVWFQWTATRTGDARFAVCGANFDTKLGLWRGTQCGSLAPLACNDDACGLQSIIVYPVTLGQTYFVQLGFFTAQYPAGTNVWGAGTLTITELAPVPNDTCSSPTVIPAGTNAIPFDTVGATVSSFNGGGCPPPGGPDVFFEWTAPAAGDYAFRTCGSSGDTAIAVHRGVGCGAICEGTNDDACGLQSILQVLGVQAGDTFLVQVAGYAANDRPSGTLSIVPFTPPACAVSDDMYEDNDVCGQAIALGDGTYPGLICREGDNDFFSVVVAPGEDLVVAAYFIDSIADLDLYLWDASAGPAGCGSVIRGVGPNNGSLSAAVSFTNNEVVTYRNTSTSPETILIEVDYFSAGIQTCNTYDLTIVGNAALPIGAPFCSPLNNSSGGPSILWVTQPPLVGDVSLNMNVAPLPMNSTGFLLMSRAATPGMPINAGNLCLDVTMLLRFQQAPVNSGPAGYVGFPFPWQIAPAPIMAGETWHFQFWHRDTAGGAAVANFSRGLSLTFQ
ncbi:MAG: hypothetical protein R3F49_17615 [Planctomycetota bacterium]